MTIRNFFAGMFLCCQPGDMTDEVWEKRLRMQQDVDNRAARKAKKAEAIRLAKIAARKQNLGAYGIPPAPPAKMLRVQSDSVLERPPRGSLYVRRGSPELELRLPQPAFARVLSTPPEPPTMPSLPPPLPSPPIAKREPTSPLAREYPREEYFADEETDQPTPLQPPPLRPSPHRRPSTPRSVRSQNSGNRLSMPANVGDYLTRGY